MGPSGCQPRDPQARQGGLAHGPAADDYEIVFCLNELLLRAPYQQPA